jgi:uncharacterized protein with ATP-grasp and redox domains
MNMSMRCLPCIVGQALKVAKLTGVPDVEAFIRDFLSYMSAMDFAKSNPEIMGRVFAMLKERCGNADPYRAVRERYDRLMLGMESGLTRAIEAASDPFAAALRYAVAGNIIDFGPQRELHEDNVLAVIEGVAAGKLTWDDSAALRGDIESARRLLYIGDNCGEIFMDKLLIRQIKQLNPLLEIIYGVRGVPVVNDAVRDDADIVGMNECARVIDNGDDSQGTVLERVSAEFRSAYDSADVIIAKGQGNFESLSGAPGNRYFLMMVKCDVVASETGIAQGSLACLNRRS